MGYFDPPGLRTELHPRSGTSLRATRFAHNPAGFEIPSATRSALARRISRSVQLLSLRSKPFKTKNPATQYSAEFQVGEYYEGQVVAPSDSLLRLLLCDPSSAYALQALTTCATFISEVYSRPCFPQKQEILLVSNPRSDHQKHP